MALYLIGDVQGCDEPLGRLLQQVGFSPSRDHLYLLGDMVNRGPDSVPVLRRLMRLQGAADCLLGNHDLSLLAAAQGVHALRPGDTVGTVLQAPDRDGLLHWLRHQPLAIHEHGVLMVHGGVLPQWDVAQVVRLAGEVEQVLRGEGYVDFLHGMFGNQPDAWRDDLQGADRLRVIVNALTRLRFCTPEGGMRLKASGPVSDPPDGTLPWFDVPGRRTAGTPVAFGHWSQLGLLLRDDVIALDTGCVWGGCLTALRLDPVTGGREVIQVKCPQAQAPAGGE